MESLDRYTGPSRLANKRLSLPCLIEDCRKGTSTSTISTPRRHTVDSVQELHTQIERKQKLKPLSFAQEPTASVAQGTPKASPRGELKGHLQRPRSAFRVPSLENQQSEDFEIRVASPVTASLIQSGQNRFANERTALCSRRSTMDATPLHLPKLPASPAKRELNPHIPRNVYARKVNPRDGMLATNLKSKFRQIGSVVMATAILRIANEKKTTDKGVS